MKKLISITVTACLWMACWMKAPKQKVQAQGLSPNVMEITYSNPPNPGSSFSITIPEGVEYMAEAWGGGGGGGAA